MYVFMIFLFSIDIILHRRSITLLLSFITNNVLAKKYDHRVVQLKFKYIKHQCIVFQAQCDQRYSGKEVQLSDFYKDQIVMARCLETSISVMARFVSSQLLLARTLRGIFRVKWQVTGQWCVNCVELIPERGGHNRPYFL